jgi:Flagellar P-ring protein
MRRSTAKCGTSRHGTTVAATKGYRRQDDPLRTLRVITALLLGLILQCGSAGAEVRIKDIADVEGVRQNQLIGYGLVVG